jgi:3-carboxy-cis,cis-muconate cycloisomerase
MQASVIDSVVFCDIFGTEAMRRVWSDDNRTQRYLDVEAADPQNYLGLVGEMVDRVLAQENGTFIQ